MYTKLFDAHDRSLRPAEIGIIRNPDNEMMPEVLELLAHKGEIWLWQMRKLFSEEAGALQSRFFVARTGGRIVSTIILIEHSGIAILGHVYTLPEERRKGLSTILIDTLLDDFRKRKGLLITLFTEYGGVPYNLYAKYGFIPIQPASGIMYFPEQGWKKLENMMSPENASVRPAQWKDYPVIAAAAFNVRDYPIKIFATDATGLAPFEVHFVYLAHHRACDPVHNQINALAKKSNDLPVGLASIMPDKRRPGGACCLDAFVQPGYERCLPELMASLKIPPNTVCYVEAQNAPKLKALENLGFKKEGSLEKPMEFRGKTFNVDIFSSGA